MANRRSPGSVLIFEAVSGGGMLGGELPPSWAAEGSAIRRAVVADFAAVAGCSVIEPIDARCFDHEPIPAHVGRIVVDPDHPIDLDSLARRVEFALIIAPESGGMLASLARQVANAGARSLGSAPEAIELCADKLRLSEHFEAVGIPTPPSRTCRFSAGLPAIETASGRVVVKPVDGAGAVDTFVLDPATANFADLRELWSYSQILIQPYRPGPSFSASFLVDRDGQAHRLAVGRQRIDVGSRGEILYRGGDLPVLDDHLDLAPVHRAVESVPGLLGFVGVDFVAVEPTGQVEVIEINPRLTTSIVGLVQLVPPATIARALLGLDRLAADFPATVPRDAPPIRFAANGSISPPRETPR